MPTTLAAWEEVEAKFKSNGITTTSQSVRAQPQMKVEDDEFVSLSQQLHRNLGPSSASLPDTADTSTSNGGKYIRYVPLYL